MLCLTFTTEAAGIAATKSIWVNRVRLRAAEGDNLVGDYITSYTSQQVEDMSDDLAYLLDIYGKDQRGKLTIKSRGSEEWGKLSKCYGLGKWWMKKPPIEFMTAVVDYKEEPFDPAWNPVINI